MKKLTLLLFACSSLIYGYSQVSNDRETCETISSGSGINALPVVAAPVTVQYAKSIIGEIFNNGVAAGGSGIGGFVTHPGAGPGGTDHSTLQNTSLGMSTIGAGMQIVNNNSIADDFTVPANTVWAIDSIVLFSYQTGSTTTSTLNDLRLQLWDAAPNGGGSVIYGDLVTNVLNDTYWTGVYRITEDAVNTNRPVMALRFEAGSPIILTAGTYWLHYSVGGSLASGPWANPITINGQNTTGNALQNIAGTWNNFTDGGTATPQGFPFIFYGTSTSSYSVNFNVTGANGTLTAEVEHVGITSGDIIEEGKTVEFIASPVYGFRIKEWAVNAIVVDGFTEPVYRIETLAEDVTVTVSFERDPEGELYNNGIASGGLGVGGIVTHPEGGLDGFDASMVQTSTLSMSTYGFSVGVATGFTIADDFTVPANTYWTIESLVFYAYQTGSTTASTLNDLRVQIWNGAPNSGGSVIFGDLVTNIMSNTSWTGVYRVLDTDPTSSTRPVMMIHAEVGTPLVLEEGTYWIEAMVGGTLGSGPFAPPITILGQSTTGNALQYIVASTTWQDLMDTGSITAQGFPFVVYGQATLFYSVTFSVTGGNGDLEAEVEGTGITSGDDVNEGESVIFTATPDDGYAVKEWKVNDVVVTGHTEEILPVSNLSEDIDVTVEFEEHIDGLDAASDEFSMFPNPFDHAITISNSTGIDHVVISNVIGKTMLTYQVNGQGRTVIDTGSLPEGIYIITLYMKNGENLIEKMTKD